MTWRKILAALFSLWLVGCAQAPTPEADAPRRIVSLDYCADQYVLRFAEREDILALSSAAEMRFSYLREEAKGLRKVRPRTADILALEPDLVVRSYGGEADITRFLEQAGVPVVQVGFPQDLAEVRSEVLRVGHALGQPQTAEAVAKEMDARLAALANTSASPPNTLYMTPAGVTAGHGTLIHELLLAAGHSNFQEQAGWHPLPLERLAYESPDLIAVAYFNEHAGSLDNWSAARHPVARAQMQKVPVVPIEGAWTACGGWFLLDAVEALAEAGKGAP